MVALAEERNERTNLSEQLQELTLRLDELQAGNSGLEKRFRTKTAILFGASGDVGMDNPTPAYLYSR